METIINSLLQNWSHLILLFFLGQFLKLILSTYLKIVEIKTLNKDFVHLEVSPDRKICEMKTSRLKIEDIEKLNKSQHLLEYKKVG